MMALVAALLLAAAQPAPAASSPAIAEDALDGCAASDADLAARCLVDRLGKEKVDAIRTDRQFDPAFYDAVRRAFRLRDPDSPVSRSLAAERLYNPHAAPVVIIHRAKKLAGVKADSVSMLREVIAFANNDPAGIEEARNASAEEWAPNFPDATRVDLKLCPDIPQRRHPQASCYRRTDGVLMIVTPNWTPKEAPRGN